MLNRGVKLTCIVVVPADTKKKRLGHTPVLVLKQYTSDGGDAMLNAAIQY